MNRTITIEGDAAPATPDDARHFAGLDLTVGAPRAAGRFPPEVVSAAMARYRAQVGAAVPQDPAVRAARDARARRRQQLRKRRGF